MDDDPPASDDTSPITESEPGANEDVDDVTEWNWPFIGAAAAVVVVLGAIVGFVTLRGDDAPPATTTTSVSTSTTTQLSAELTIAELLPLDTQFAAFVDLVGSGEMSELLDDDGELTVLIPSSEALEDVDLPSDQDTADALLRRHLVEGVLSTRDLADLDGSTVTTLSGDELEVVVGDDRSISIGGAAVVKRQIAASNGAIYVVGGLVAADG